MDIHQKIKKLLERRKLTQDELAIVLGVTGKTVHNYLNGHTKLYAYQIPIIARFLKVPIIDLFDSSEDLLTFEEPIGDYGLNVDHKLLCDQKTETIKAKDETIALLKGQIEYLKSKIEG